MKIDSIRKFILPPGPILSLTLIGALLLSAVLYYRAIKIQRFLEPALAITQPRIEFSENISRLFSDEFGTRKVRGIRFTTNSILVGESLLFHPDLPGEETGREILKKLSRVFLSVLKDPKMKAHVDLILVSAKLSLGPDPEQNWKRLRHSQEIADLILRSLYDAEPDLEKDFGAYFAATALPAELSEVKSGVVEFRIIPTAQLHIEVLQRLQKYMQ